MTRFCQSVDKYVDKKNQQNEGFSVAQGTF